MSSKLLPSLLIFLMFLLLQEAKGDDDSTPVTVDTSGVSIGSVSLDYAIGYNDSIASNSLKFSIPTSVTDAYLRAYIYSGTNETGNQLAACYHNNLQTPAVLKSLIIQVTQVQSGNDSTVSCQLVLAY